jgi:hypothetical protein
MMGIGIVWAVYFPRAPASWLNLQFREDVHKPHLRSHLLSVSGYPSSGRPYFLRHLEQALRFATRCFSQFYTAKFSKKNYTVKIDVKAASPLRWTRCLDTFWNVVLPSSHEKVRSTSTSLYSLDTYVQEKQDLLCRVNISIIPTASAIPLRTDYHNPPWCQMGPKDA